jgi:hypothetical protein
MSHPSMSEMTDPPQPHPVTLCHGDVAFRISAMHARGVAVREISDAATLSLHAAYTTISNLWSNQRIIQMATSQVGSPETIKVLLICVAVMVAAIVGITAALLTKVSGQCIQNALLKGGATFAGAIGVLLLIMHYIGLV